VNRKSEKALENWSQGASERHKGGEKPKKRMGYKVAIVHIHNESKATSSKDQRFVKAINAYF
jgi:hypothetical protein